MLKNKFIVAFISLAIGIIFYYSFFNNDSFEVKTKKSFEKYKTDLINLENSPIKTDGVNDFDFFEPDKNYVIEANFVENQSEQKSFNLIMTDTSQSPAVLAGKANFEFEGQKVNLLIFEEEDNYVLPFNDLTNGQETYGGGRYINIAKSALLGNMITIDFNNAHNYYCNYNDTYICPIPPKENKINFKINAGEKTYLKTK
jgi:uncharacterized protein